MGQPLSIEDESWTYLITTRTAGSKLWLINNPSLERKILGILARYQYIHGVLLYAFILMGNHYHLVARFPRRNRAQFMRDFNSAVARAVGRSVKEHGRRSVWARRYAYQILPRDEDVRNWFFYAALNPVSSGLTRTVEAYQSYNSFNDAAAGKVKTYEWIDWSKYLMKSRYQPSAKPEDFAIEYSLEFSRLPGVGDLSPEDYERTLRREADERQQHIVEDRESRGEGFLSDSRHQPRIGSHPFSTKTSTRYTYRPIVLSLCMETKRQVLDIYFATLDRFKEASKRFQTGCFEVEFPSGTYPPPRILAV